MTHSYTHNLKNGESRRCGQKKMETYENKCKNKGRLRLSTTPLARTGPLMQAQCILDLEIKWKQVMSSTLW
jgi:hypothetical protein